ncbi:MAG: hypothetical protein HFE81_05240 [Bacilli bacterium]|nr:hypothetical protein [Bacilli bacterium]
MKIEFRKKLFELLFKDKQVITDRDRSLEISEKKDEIARKSFMYRRHENVKIDDSFKYYHFELTGNLSKILNIYMEEMIFIIQKIYLTILLLIMYLELEEAMILCFIKKMMFILFIMEDIDLFI